MPATIIITITITADRAPAELLFETTCYRFCHMAAEYVLVIAQ
jgi:hypothetical protein